MVAKGSIEATIQIDPSYSSGGANVAPRLIRGSLGSPRFAPETTSGSVSSVFAALPKHD